MMPDDPFMRWARIELWRFKVCPIRGMDAYLEPYYFTNMAELIYIFERAFLLKPETKHLRLMIEIVIYEYIQIKQIVYN